MREKAFILLFYHPEENLKVLFIFLYLPDQFCGSFTLVNHCSWRMTSSPTSGVSPTSGFSPTSGVSPDESVQHLESVPHLEPVLNTTSLKKDFIYLDN